MGTVKINQSIIGSGNSVIIKNGKIIVDGKDVTPDSKEISITIEGDIKELSVDSCQKISVNGNVDRLSSVSGDVEVGGNVINGGIQSTSGDVDVSGNVTGDIKTVSGDVDCGDVSGSIKTVSGDIKTRKSK